MCDNRGLKTALALPLLAVSFLLAAGGFEDPKPPSVSAPDGRAEAQPGAHPGVRFHKAAKPLRHDAVSADWPAFLGPHGNSVSRETALLKRFGESGPPLVWEMEKGPGYSSPSIQGDYLVFLHRSGREEVVECLHPETGESYWTFRYPTDFEDRYGYNNGPRATPVIDGSLVYTYGAEGKLHCLRLATGQVAWSRDIASEFRVPQDFFGTASTPVIEGDLLILNVGAPGGPEVIALDKSTGRAVWGVGDRWGPSYATPVVAEVHGDRRLFVLGGGESNPPTGGLLAINPATGGLEFRFPWRSRSFESVNASSPVVVDDTVLVSATYRTGAALLRIGSNGGFSKLWENREFDLHWNTAVYREGHFYAFSGRNEPDARLTAVDAETGETAWSEVLEWTESVSVNGESRTFHASPLRGHLLWADGNFLALGEHGHLLWLDLSPSGPEVLARTRLFLARETWSPPVVSRGLLYVVQNARSIDPPSGPRLLCYDLRAR